MFHVKLARAQEWTPTLGVSRGTRLGVPHLRGISDDDSALPCHAHFERSPCHQTSLPVGPRYLCGQGTELIDPRRSPPALHAVKYMNAETVDYLGAITSVDSSPFGLWHLTHFDIGASRLHDPNRSDSAIPVRGGSEPLVWPHRLRVRRYGSEGGGSAPQLLAVAMPELVDHRVSRRPDPSSG